MRTRGHLILVATIVAWPVPAAACILCHSPQSISVRARLLQPDLWLNLGAVALPLAVMAWIVALVCLGPVTEREA